MEISNKIISFLSQSSLFLFLFLFLFPTFSFGQNPYSFGYIFDLNKEMPDKTYTLKNYEVISQIGRMEVSSIGTGKTSIANSKNVGSFLQNPAILSNKRKAIEIVPQAAISIETFYTLSFINNNINDFTDGTYLIDLKKAFDEFITTFDKDKLNKLLVELKGSVKFPQDFVSKIAGSYDDAKVYGLTICPAVVGQWDNWGFAFEVNGQISFAPMKGSLLEALEELVIPEDVSQVTPELYRKLGAIALTAVTPDGKVNSSALPNVFAFSCIDIISSVGYGFSLDSNLSIGANLKLVNRRFTTKLIEKENLEDVLKESANELSNSILGVTGDIGLNYHIPKYSTNIAVVLQNLLPFKTIFSTAQHHFVKSNYTYKRDSNNAIITGYGSALYDKNNFINDPKGDTVIIISGEQLQYFLPFSLISPFAVNIGIMKSITKNWDIAAEFSGLFSGDNWNYKNFGDRISIGTEYRFFNNILALRTGYAHNYITLGTGAQFSYQGAKMGIDAAFTKDNFTNMPSVFLQFKIGWESAKNDLTTQETE